MVDDSAYIKAHKMWELGITMRELGLVSQDATEALWARYKVERTRLRGIQKLGRMAATWRR